MAERKDQIADLIGRDHANRQKQHWRGTFLDYLEMLRDNPSIYKLAHAHLHDIMMQTGISKADEADRKSVV